MPACSTSIDVPADARTAFDLIHDYTCRLDWDSMLSEARLLDGATQAGLGVTSRCVGGWRVGRSAVESRYITFKPGQVAAVEMTRGPWFFESFTASIRHQPLEDGTSRVTYTYSLIARPRWLRFLIEPLLQWIMSWEVRWRLASLANYLRDHENNGSGAGYCDDRSSPSVPQALPK